MRTIVRSVPDLVGLFAVGAAAVAGLPLDRYTKRVLNKFINYFKK